MPAANQPPYTADEFAKLVKRVENLERKRPSAVQTSTDLWQQLGGALTAAKNPSTINIGASGLVSLGSPTEALISSPTLVTLLSGINIDLIAPIITVDGLSKWAEVGAPAGAPPSGSAYVWAQDNGAGKTELLVRFKTGATQVIKIEP